MWPRAGGTDRVRVCAGPSLAVPGGLCRETSTDLVLTSPRGLLALVLRVVGPRPAKLYLRLLTTRLLSLWSRCQLRCSSKFSDLKVRPRLHASCVPPRWPWQSPVVSPGVTGSLPAGRGGQVGGVRLAGAGGGLCSQRRLLSFLKASLRFPRRHPRAPLPQTWLLRRRRRCPRLGNGDRAERSPCEPARSRGGSRAASVFCPSEASVALDRKAAGPRGPCVRSVLNTRGLLQPGEAARPVCACRGGPGAPAAWQPPRPACHVPQRVGAPGLRRALEDKRKILSCF